MNALLHRPYLERQAATVMEIVFVINLFSGHILSGYYSVMDYSLASNIYEFLNSFDR